MTRRPSYIRDVLAGDHHLRKQSEREAFDEIIATAGRGDEPTSYATIQYHAQMDQCGWRLKSWWVHLRELLNAELERSRPPKRLRDGDEVIAHEDRLKELLAQDRALADGLEACLIPFERWDTEAVRIDGELGDSRNLTRAVHHGSDEYVNPAAVMLVRGAVEALAKRLGIPAVPPTRWTPDKGFFEDPELVSSRELARWRKAHLVATYTAQHGAPPPRDVSREFAAVAGVTAKRVQRGPRKSRQTAGPAAASAAAKLAPTREHRLDDVMARVLAVLRNHPAGMKKGDLRVEAAPKGARMLSFGHATQALEALERAKLARSEGANERRLLWFPV